MGLIIGGEAIPDIFKTGLLSETTKRFDTVTTINCLGGAGRASDLLFNWNPDIPIYLSFNIVDSKLIRYININRKNKDYELVLDIWEPRRNHFYNPFMRRLEYCNVPLDTHYQVQLILDYALQPSVTIATTPSPILVVDSKYQSLPVWDIRANYKIWHCTGGEYTVDYAKNFDAVIWSNGGQDIRLIDNNLKQECVLPVPFVEVAPYGEIGAGDILSTTVAYYLSQTTIPGMTKQEYFGFLIDATLAGIKVAQSTLNTSFISQTNLLPEDL